MLGGIFPPSPILPTQFGNIGMNPYLNQWDIQSNEPFWASTKPLQKNVVLEPKKVSEYEWLRGRVKEVMWYAP
jgi:hypothetical protein